VCRFAGFYAFHLFYASFGRGRFVLSRAAHSPLQTMRRAKTTLFSRVSMQDFTPRTHQIYTTGTMSKTVQESSRPVRGPVQRLFKVLSSARSWVRYLLPTNLSPSVQRKPIMQSLHPSKSPPGNCCPTRRRLLFSSRWDGVLNNTCT
jgi:hypothetical protein